MLLVFFFSHELNSKHTVIYILFYTSSFNTDKVKLNYTKSKENYSDSNIYAHNTSTPSLICVCLGMGGRVITYKSAHSLSFT